MSKIDEQIKQLQARKAQIAELTTLIDSVGKMLTTEDLRAKVITFAESIKAGLEEGLSLNELGNLDNDKGLTGEEIKVLKALASKALQRNSDPSPKVPKKFNPQRPIFRNSEIDPIRFVQKFNDAIGKEVRDLDGKVLGKLQSPAYPDVIVISPEGETMQISSDLIQVSK